MAPVAPVAKKQKKSRKRSRYTLMGHGFRGFRAVRGARAGIICINLIFPLNFDERQIIFFIALDLRVLRALRFKTSRPPVALFEAFEPKNDDVNISMVSIKSTESMDISNASNSSNANNANTLDQSNQPTAEELRHLHASTELKRTLFIAIHCLLTMISIILTKDY